jgi:hypothetical protein
VQARTRRATAAAVQTTFPVLMKISPVSQPGTALAPACPARPRSPDTGAAISPLPMVLGYG